VHVPDRVQKTRGSYFPRPWRQLFSSDDCPTNEPSAAKLRRRGEARPQESRLAEAEDQFQRALKRAPANGWSYYGLLQLYKSRGDAKAAAQAEAELAKTWVGDRQLLQISNL
jgi:tetratricopeptide (TPR) repeat protein